MSISKCGAFPCLSVCVSRYVIALVDLPPSLPPIYLSPSVYSYLILKKLVCGQKWSKTHGLQLWQSAPSQCWLCCLSQSSCKRGSPSSWTSEYLINDFPLSFQTFLPLWRGAMDGRMPGRRSGGGTDNCQGWTRRRRKQRERKQWIIGLLGGKLSKSWCPRCGQVAGITSKLPFLFGFFILYWNQSVF